MVDLSGESRWSLESLYRKLEDKNAALRAEIEGLTGRCTCVWCGSEYHPGQAQPECVLAMKSHMEICEKNPIHKLRSRLARVEGSAREFWAIARDINPSRIARVILSLSPELPDLKANVEYMCELLDICERLVVASEPFRPPLEADDEAQGSGRSTALLGSLSGKPDIRPCLQCGADEGSHHNYEPVVRPPGCVCDWREWGKPEAIPPICPKFVGIEGYNCQTCEHDAECHKGA